MAANFFAARIKEIENLSNEIVRHPERGLQFQNLPFKCRRRAASHHRNRIPMRIRDCHPDIEPGGKRPSKKYKKRRSIQERKVNAKRVKHWMQTHKWHAKRFHMTRIENDWIVPLTANHKNFRAVYRATVKHLYMEDNSYWRCLKISARKDAISSCFGKVIGNLVLHQSLQACLVAKSEVDVWLYDKENSLLLGNVKCQWLSEECTLIWCHPTAYQKLMEIFKQSLIGEVTNDSLCRFRFFGSNVFNDYFEKYLDGNASQQGGNVVKFKLSSLDPTIFKDSDADGEVVQISQRCCDLILPEQHGFKVWLKFVHEIRHLEVGCLESQEQIDNEYRRMSCMRLQPDLLLSQLPEKWTQPQKSLIDIAKIWVPGSSSFMVLREAKELLRYQKLMTTGNAEPFKESTSIPAFLPICIEMAFGGKLEEGSKLYFPSEIKVSQKMVKEALQVPFIDDPVVGILTTSTFSQRIACCSGLGLVSVDALKIVHKQKLLSNYSTIAVLNPLNGLLYRARVKLLTE